MMKKEIKMYTELLNNLIYPIITTSIGAWIGGIYAYKVARNQYSRDRLNETIGFIFLLKKTVDRIDEKSKEIKKHIEKLEMRECTEKSYETDLMKLMFQIHLEIDTNFSRLIKQWKTFKESVSLCGSKFICKNSETRKNIETLEDKFSRLSSKLQAYINLCKAFKKKYDNEEKKEEFNIYSFLDSNNSKLEKAVSYLEKITNLCKKINEIYENLERNYV